MSITSAMKALKTFGACEDAVDWLSTQPSSAGAWATCPRGDWMLWLLGRLADKAESDARRKLVLCACEVARQALRYVPAGEDRPRVAIETAERWARREPGVTLADVRRAAAAYAAASAAYATAATATADRAADAAYAAASAAADAAADAADARAQSLAASADIVRRHYQTPPTDQENPR